jgi:hypothetical protein
MNVCIARILFKIVRHVPAPEPADFKGFPEHFAVN